MRTLLPLLALGSLAACRHEPPPPGHDAAVVGTVRWSEPVALPAQARLRVLLLDIDAPDVPDFIVASHESVILHEPPLRFSLGYDPHALHPDVLYGVAAEVLVRGAVRLATPRPVPVLTRGHPDRVALVLARRE